MSTAIKRPWAEARADAESFCALFEGCYERWEVAGSIRRGKPEVGDVEHVVIPATGVREVREGGLFGVERASMNLLLARCDELLAAGTIVKHVYAVNHAVGTTGTRTMWGEKYRGISFRGHLHEIFSATPDNWGSILAIRTGPAEFSQRLVTALHPRGLQQADGVVRYKRDGAIYPTRTEEAFFAACGMEWVEPADRR